MSDAREGRRDDETYALYRQLTDAAERWTRDDPVADRPTVSVHMAESFGVGAGSLALDEFAHAYYIKDSARPVSADSIRKMFLVGVTKAAGKADDPAGRVRISVQWLEGPRSWYVLFGRAA